MGLPSLEQTRTDSTAAPLSARCALFWDGDVSMGDQWFRNGLRPLMVLAWGFPWPLKTGEADQDFGRVQVRLTGNLCHAVEKK